MAVDVECPNCHAELEMNGRKALAAETFECARCGTVSPMPGSQMPREHQSGSSRREQAGTSTPPKSAVAAGLLQLFFGFLGLGRFYLGYTAVGLSQLALWIVGLLMVFFGWLLLFVFSIIGFMLLAALGIWVLVEAIMMIAGAIPDADGHKLC